MTLIYKTSQLMVCSTSRFRILTSTEGLCIKRTARGECAGDATRDESDHSHCRSVIVKHFWDLQHAHGPPKCKPWSIVGCTETMFRVDKRLRASLAPAHGIAKEEGGGGAKPTWLNTAAMDPFFPLVNEGLHWERQFFTHVGGEKDAEDWTVRVAFTTHARYRGRTGRCG